MNKISKFAKKPLLLINSVLCRTASLWPDDLYIKLKGRSLFEYSFNIKEPQTFNEKLNWMKLYYRNPLFTLFADKYWVKQWVARQIGAEHVVPCYGHWRYVEDIDFNKLPERCFFKSNHDSGGGVLIDKNKEADIRALKHRFGKKSFLKKNWYWVSREFAYKNIEPCILAEQYLDEGTGHELHDYKFWCFNGEPLYMYITNKGHIVKENFYDMDFRVANIDHGFKRIYPEYERPECFEEMRKLAKRLSDGIPFVRIDFFFVGGKVYFGEYTFYDWAGFRPFGSYEQDLMLGGLIDLSRC